MCFVTKLLLGEERPDTAAEKGNRQQPSFGMPIFMGYRTALVIPEQEKSETVDCEHVDAGPQDLSTGWLEEKLREIHQSNSLFASSAMQSRGLSTRA